MRIKHNGAQRPRESLSVMEGLWRRAHPTWINWFRMPPWLYWLSWRRRRCVRCGRSYWGCWFREFCSKACDEAELADVFGPLRRRPERKP